MSHINISSNAKTNKTTKSLIIFNSDKRKNRHLEDIKEQEAQNRNLGKKAIKVIEGKKKEKIININKVINQRKNLDKIKINSDNNEINQIENFLKDKTTKKNFLGSSINFSLMEELSPPKFNPKTDIKKNNNKNINESSEIKESTSIINEINESKTSDNQRINKSYKINLEINNNDSILNINNILIPLLNQTKENNCFLNVIIQVLFQLKSFQQYILTKLINSPNIINDVVKEFCNLINSYSSEQEKNIKSKIPLEPVLSVNLLRKKLNHYYGNYFTGDCGDPMETLEHIFESIHDEYNSKNNLSKNSRVPCSCVIHKFFFFNLCEINACIKCKKFIKRQYDKNCFMIQIFISEITKRINENNLTFESIRLKLFYKIKEQNEKYDISNKRIEGCKCPEIKNIKNLKLVKANNLYVIMNLTWSEQFPDLTDILNIYTSLPLSDKNNHLFRIDEKKEKKLYIKSIILYGICHYICVIYLTKFKKWGIIDDKTIGFIDKYYDLVEYLLKNHLSPVGLIYSYDECDKINEMDIGLNNISKEKYIKMYKLCKDIDSSKELKMSWINQSKKSLDLNNNDYLDNNAFYNHFYHKVILSSISSYNDDEKEENRFQQKKSSWKKKSSEEENEKNNDINLNSNNSQNSNTNQKDNLKGSVLIFES